MEEYSIHRTDRDSFAVVSNLTIIAEYKMSADDAKALDKSIRQHLADGGTLGNYQW